MRKNIHPALCALRSGVSGAAAHKCRLLELSAIAEFQSVTVYFYHPVQHNFVANNTITQQMALFEKNEAPYFWDVGCALLNLRVDALASGSRVALQSRMRVPLGALKQTLETKRLTSQSHFFFLKILDVDISCGCVSANR